MQKNSLAFSALTAGLVLLVGLTVGCENPTAPDNPDSPTKPPVEPVPDQIEWSYLEIDFDTEVANYVGPAFDGSGLAADPQNGQLDSDSWSIAGLSDGDLPFGGTRTDGDYARGDSTGGVSTGGLYAFAVEEANVALGVQPTSSDFAPGSITLLVGPASDGDKTLAELSIGFTLWWFNDQGRSTHWYVQVSGDGESWVSLTGLDHTTAETEDAEPLWSSIRLETNVDLATLDSAVSAALDGGDIFIRWVAEDGAGTGGRDEAAIDDIVIGAGR